MKAHANNEIEIKIIDKIQLSSSPEHHGKFNHNWHKPSLSKAMGIQVCSNEGAFFQGEMVTK